MIITLLLNIAYSFIDGLILLLPVGSLPTQFMTAVNYFWGIFNSFSYIIPVQTLFEALLIVLAFDLVLLGWRFLNWIIRKLPGVN